MAKEAKKAATEEAAPKKKGKLLIIIIAAVVVLGAAGGAAWWFLVGQKGGEDAAKEEKAHAAPEGPPIFVTLEPFTVNLQGGASYLQVALVLKVSDKKLDEEIKGFMPEIRSDLLLLLSNQRAEEINTVKGKEVLAEEIAHAVNHILHAEKPEDGVSGVYFTSFVIQ